MAGRYCGFRIFDLSHDINEYTPDTRNLSRVPSYQGTLPTEIGLLTNLQILDLDQPNVGPTSGLQPAIRGTLPTELGLCTRVVDFSFAANNQITGSLPTQLFALTGITAFAIDGASKLSGALPTHVGKLTALTSFIVTSDQALASRMPTEIGMLTALTSLSFASPVLTNSIGISCENPGESSVDCALIENGFRGALPTELGRLTALVSFDIGSAALGTHNSFSSVLPTELGLLTALTELLTANNYLSGTVPTTFAALTNIESGKCALSATSGTPTNGFEGGDFDPTSIGCTVTYLSSPPPSPPIAAGEIIEAEITVAGTVQEFGGVARAKFRAGIAALLGVDVSRVRITNVLSASVIIKFQITKGSEIDLATVLSTVLITEISDATGASVLALKVTSGFDDTSDGSTAPSSAPSSSSTAENNENAENAELAPVMVGAIAGSVAGCLCLLSTGFLVYIYANKRKAAGKTAGKVTGKVAGKAGGDVRVYDAPSLMSNTV